VGPTPLADTSIVLDRNRRGIGEYQSNQPAQVRRAPQTHNATAAGAARQWHPLLLTWCVGPQLGFRPSGCCSAVTMACSIISPRSPNMDHVYLLHVIIQHTSSQNRR
jgi:hypothetical protein